MTIKAPNTGNISAAERVTLVLGGLDAITAARVPGLLALLRVCCTRCFLNGEPMAARACVRNNGTDSGAVPLRHNSAPGNRHADGTHVPALAGGTLARPDRPCSALECAMPPKCASARAAGERRGRRGLDGPGGRGTATCRRCLFWLARDAAERRGRPAVTRCNRAVHEARVDGTAGGGESPPRDFSRRAAKNAPAAGGRHRKLQEGTDTDYEGARDAGYISEPCTSGMLGMPAGGAGACAGHGLGAPCIAPPAAGSRPAREFHSAAIDRTGRCSRGAFIISAFTSSLGCSQLASTVAAAPSLGTRVLSRTTPLHGPPARKGTRARPPASVVSPPCAAVGHPNRHRYRDQDCPPPSPPARADLTLRACSRRNKRPCYRRYSPAALRRPRRPCCARPFREACRRDRSWTGTGSFRHIYTEDRARHA